MVNVIILAVVSAAGLLMMNDNEPPAPPVPVQAQPSFEPLASAMYWLGGCSVTCSLLWSGCIVYTSKLKRKDYR